MAPTPIFAYWDVRGLAQPVRLLLKYADVKFEDKLYVCGPAPNYDKSCWFNEKNLLGLDFPNLPYYIDGDTKLTQSNAITRHIARKHGLGFDERYFQLISSPDGKNEAEKDRIEVAAGELLDWRGSWSGFCYGGGEDQKETDAKYLKEADGHLQQLSKFLGQNDWIAGKNISWVDFIAYELLYQHRTYKTDILTKYPNLQQFMDRFEQLPKIKAYMESVDYIKYPFNNRMARWGG